MAKMPRISSREAIRALERLGFEQVRQTGSHVVLKKETEETGSSPLFKLSNLIALLLEFKKIGWV